MTRTEKYKKLRVQLKLESLVIQSTYLKAQSEELLKHTTQFKKQIQKEYHTDLPKVYTDKDWWKDYSLMEDIKPK